VDNSATGRSLVQRDPTECGVSVSDLEFSAMRRSWLRQEKNMKHYLGRLKSGSFCYRSVQNILCCSFLSKYINIKTHRHIILSVLCGCESWSLILREEHKVRILENRVPRKFVFGLKRDEVTGVEKTT
jgi:hypothetical protein